MKDKKFNIQLEAKTLASINLDQIITNEVDEIINNLVNSKHTDMAVNSWNPKKPKVTRFELKLRFRVAFSYPF